MPDISTLVQDIEGLFEKVLDGETVEVDDSLIDEFGKAVASKLRRALSAREKVRPPKTLYMSEVGKPCHRQIWYSYHKPELGERLLPHTKLKFLYGDIIEELVLLLARVAGHEVTDEQKASVLHLRNGWEVRGYSDAKVDGALVDVKSASGYSFEKFKKGLTDETDSFGYRVQLYSYHLADEAHKAGDEMGFLVMNKETGKLHYDPLTHVEKVFSRFEGLTKALEDASNPPDRAFKLDHDKMGNGKLCTECAYCLFKHECWKDANEGAGLRTFVYSTGPVFLGTVHKTPNVPEITDKIKRVRETHVIPKEELEPAPS